MSPQATGQALAHPLPTCHFDLGNWACSTFISYYFLSFLLMNEVCGYKIQSSQAWNLIRVFTAWTQILSCGLILF